MIIKGAEIPLVASRAGTTGLRRATTALGGHQGPPVLRDVRIEDGAILAVAATIEPGPAEPVIEGGGGALLPGLHDHHIHLLSLAAWSRSVPCGPPEVQTREALLRALREADARTPAGEWIRGVAYHESVAGELDRWALDAFVSDRPVRVQHRSGQLWMLNSAGLRALGAEDGVGRLLRSDAWIRDRLEGGRGENRRVTPDHQDLAQVSRALAATGVTGVTDATFTNGPCEARMFFEEVAHGRLLQYVLLMGSEHLAPESGPPDSRVVGAHLKVMVHDDDLPDPDELADRFRAAHGSRRPVAVHCVTRAELVVALSAFKRSGVRNGDRIEHAGIVPDECVDVIRALALSVVTQPNFISERGDEYGFEVDAEDLDLLYRLASLDRAGLAVGGGTDAPFGRPDPWAAMRAAVHRETAGGALLGPDEAVTPERALWLFTTPPGAPGGTPRSVSPGSRADLVLLAAPWREAREVLSSELVVATFVGGNVVTGAGRNWAAAVPGTIE